MFSMVISLILEVISVDFGDFGESCYPSLWTASTFCISVAVWGDHTVEAYSNCGLTTVLYATDFRSLLWTRMFLFRKPIV